MVPYLWPDNRGRRSGIDRRKFSYALVIPERRSGRDRRTGFDRRSVQQARSEGDPAIFCAQSRWQR
jgi:hypothetical protein